MIALIILADLYLFFILYVACMGMIRAHDEGKLNWLLWALCVPFVAMSWIIDVTHNVTLFSLIFGEWPRELTVTERLKRHVNEHTYRGKIARWMADNLLNPFDSTGDHLD